MMNPYYHSRYWRAAVLFAICVLANGPLRADLIQLYDPTLGTLPGDQGWVSVVLPPATESHNGTLLSLNTTASRNSQAGFFSELPSTGGSQHPLIPELDRQMGFTIRFDLQVVSEGHNNRDDNGDGLFDRAGFSVISISEDLFGLELAFFENRIWSYAAAGEGSNSRFTQAEGVDFDTTAALTQYELAFAADEYRLSANGIEILTGAVRNYNPSGLNPLLDPYDNPSFLFFGDDTTSADSNVLLGSIEVSTVPESGTMLLMWTLFGGVMLRWGMKRRRAIRAASN